MALLFVCFFLYFLKFSWKKMYDLPPLCIDKNNSYTTYNFISKFLLRNTIYIQNMFLFKQVNS